MSSDSGMTPEKAKGIVSARVPLGSTATLEFWEATGFLNGVAYQEEKAKGLVEALTATDIYFKALTEQWAANDGRVVSESGVVINAAADVQRLCDEAGEKVGKALAHYRQGLEKP